MPNGKVTGCLPQSVYENSTKNKTIRSTIKWMLTNPTQWMACLRGECSHKGDDQCAEALQKKFTESNEKE